MSGTSLSTAIANENGSTNAVSAHTDGATVSVPPNARVKCPYMPRLTTVARTPAMHGAAANGWRLRRTGGSEYAQPTTSAVTAAAVSSAPWVRPSATGTAAATATIHHAASTDRSPAAIGREGLLVGAI